MTAPGKTFMEVVLAPDLALMSDEDLLIRCRGAPADEVRRAIGIVARRHAGALIAYLARFVRDRTEAEDLAQEAFLRLFRHARAYKEIARVSTWLYRIAHNLGCNELRRRSYRASLSLDAPLGGEDADGALGDSVAGPDPAPEAIAQDADRSRRVREAIEGLPEHFREVLLQVDIRGASYEEAARALNVKVGTIRSRLFRAREKLMDEMGPWVDGI